MKNKLYIGIFAVLSLTIISCEDLVLGDGFLEQGQSSTVNLDSIYAKKVYAEQALSRVYTSLPYGLPIGNSFSVLSEGNTKVGHDLLESLTDLNNSELAYGGANLYYYTGALNSSVSPVYANTSFTKGSWRGIRDAFSYLENVDRVPDMTDQEKAIRKAEAKTIVALHYAEMFRYFGGLPKIDRTYPPSVTPNLPRMTVEETVNYIVSLCDQAAAVLPWSIADPKTDDGRMTAAAALGIKIRVLQFAASPLFNDDAPYLAGEAADKRVTWLGGKDQNRWKAVENACYDFLNRLNNDGGYSLVATGDARADFLKGYYNRNNGEVIISIRKLYQVPISTSSPVDPGNCLLSNFFENAKYGTGNTTLNYVDMFPMANGQDFDWNNPLHAAAPFFDAAGNPTRDPRLYETVVVNGDKFQGGKAQLYDGGNEKVINTKYAVSGFAIRKFRLDAQATRGTIVQWPYLRLPEIYLAYAEALNEVNNGPTPMAEMMLNMTRDRVNVDHYPSGLSQDAFREAILRERALEFGYEEVRYFDLVRYKRIADFQKQLYGLQIIRNSTTGALTFNKFPITTARVWQTSWNPKWFLTPIPLSEINIGYGLIQNPGW